jgi:spore coat polysaccharide biosynthesis protein SpsF
MKHKIGAIVQARMTSSRLPGKVLYEVAGKPMLQYLLERLEQCNCLDASVVATSVDDSDTPIAKYCRQHGVSCHRGSLTDVAGRFKEALDVNQFDTFARVNGDSPLLDQRLIEKGVDIFVAGDFDIVTNAQERTYPKGQTVEILRADTFRYGYKSMRAEDEFEHVTPYFYKHPEDFKIHNFALPQNLNHIRLSVDTQEDMDTFAAIVSRMETPHWEYTLDDIVEIHSRLVSRND